MRRFCRPSKRRCAASITERSASAATAESRSPMPGSRPSHGRARAARVKRSNRPKGHSVQQDELQQFLSECAADRLAILLRLEAGARVVGHYDFNNTYQYVIARQETHLSWLEAALAETGAKLPPAKTTLRVPPVSVGKKTPVPAAYRDVLVDDARHLAAFVTAWTPRVQAMTHARHRKMLTVMLGETVEHQRLFEQAAQGFGDVLGRRAQGVAPVGSVLPARWQE